MPPLLRGKAAIVNLVLEEGAVFDPTFHNLAESAVDELGEHEPFEEYTTGYLTAMSERGGDVMFTLGPIGEDDMDGECEVDADAGTVACLLAPLASIGLPFPAPRYTGYYNLVLYPGGDAGRAVRYAEGDLHFSRRGSLNPPEEE